LLLVLPLAGLGAAPSCAPTRVGFDKAFLSDLDLKAIPDFQLRSEAAFRLKVHPILRAYCSSCHRSDSGQLGSNYPHADESVEIAHTTAIGNHFVNFAHPERSRFVEVANGDHVTAALVSALDENEATRLETAIAEWGAIRGPDPTAAFLSPVLSLPRVSTLPAPSPSPSPIPQTLELGSALTPPVSDGTQPVLTFSLDQLNGLYRLKNFRISNPTGSAGLSLKIKNIQFYHDGDLLTHVTGLKLVDQTIPPTANSSPAVISSNQQVILIAPRCQDSSPADCQDEIRLSFEQLQYVP
jgi:hypothetical protein